MAPAGSLAQDEPSFPLTVVDDEGTEVTIGAYPERIISLSPANTETVFALGDHTLNLSLSALTLVYHFDLTSHVAMAPGPAAMLILVSKPWRRST